ncbi:MAG TPA: hypothetical protein VEV81_13060 [Pyrinomonadaceae bacterium]|nr:hypothetical protein [Pyrinomonadaceae bacterium]
MSLLENGVEIRTGRREGDGHIHVSFFAGEMVALSLEGHGERAPTLLLTLEQARKLQGALAAIIPLMEEAVREEENLPGTWRGTDRRLAS